jgi:cell division protein FtsL
MVLEVLPCVRSYDSKPLPIRRRRKRFSFHASRRVMLTVFCCVCLYGFVGSGVRPYVQAHRLSEDARDLAAQIQAEEQRNAALSQRICDLQTPSGERNAARMYGWVLPGEIAIACPCPHDALSRESDSSILAPPVPTRLTSLQRCERFLEW